MGMRIGLNNSNVKVIKLRNATGSSAGTVRISSPEKKKLKRLNYNFKQISSQILLTKTSGGANRIKIRASLQITAANTIPESCGWLSTTP